MWPLDMYSVPKWTMCQSIRKLLSCLTFSWCDTCLAWIRWSGKGNFSNYLPFSNPAVLAKSLYSLPISWLWMTNPHHPTYRTCFHPHYISTLKKEATHCFAMLIFTNTCKRCVTQNTIILTCCGTLQLYITHTHTTCVKPSNLSCMSPCTFYPSN
jgi:hypothetical protein